jgi:hypothetical protein
MGGLSICFVEGGALCAAGANCCYHCSERAVSDRVDIFNARVVAFGALMFSARLDAILLRRHCRMKAWRYSQAAKKQIN